MHVAYQHTVKMQVEEEITKMIWCAKNMVTKLMQDSRAEDGLKV